MKAVNLIPAEQRKGGAIGRRSQGVAFGVLGLLAGAAILTFLYGSASHQLKSRKAEAAALTNQAQQVQAQAAQLSSYTSFIQMREQRLQAISQLIGSRFDWSATMYELSRVLPANISLSSLQGTIGSATATASPSAAAPAAPAAGSTASTTSTAAAAAAPVTSATPPGATPTFTLAGCGGSQIAVAQMLVRLRLVSGVSNVTLQSSARSGSSGGGGSGGSGGTCPADDPSFTAQVSFQPLPSPPSSSAETLEASDSGESNASGSSPKSGPKAASTSGKGAAG
jgi:Tfp pilus assembly protein PilN